MSGGLCVKPRVARALSRGGPSRTAERSFAFQGHGLLCSNSASVTKFTTGPFRWTFTTEKSVYAEEGRKRPKQTAKTGAFKMNTSPEPVSISGRCHGNACQVRPAPGPEGLRRDKQAWRVIGKPSPEKRALALSCIKLRARVALTYDL